MGKGRTPIPKRLRQLMGSKRGVGQNPEQPTFAAERVIEPPPILTGLAVDCWVRFSQILSRSMLFTEGTREQLMRYCMAFRDWHEIQDERNKLGRARFIPTMDSVEQTRNEKGRVIATTTKVGSARILRHWRSELIEAARTMENFEREYGMTPAAATRVKLGALLPVSGTDSFDQFLDSNPLLTVTELEPATETTSPQPDSAQADAHEIG